MCAVDIPSAALRRISSDEVVRSSGSVELKARRACTIDVSSSDLAEVALLGVLEK